MATYYVRQDGNNANSGTGPAVNQAWSTLAFAFANMALPDAVNTLYIAPGTYRESPTLSITPSVTNTLVISGDPTASQFTGVSSGRVRITAFTSDNLGYYATTAPTLVFDNKTYFTLQNVHVEGYQQTSGTGIAHFINAKNYTVQNCLFSLYRRGVGANCLFVTTTTNTAINATFNRCVIHGGYAGINIQGPTTSTAFNFNIAINDCYIVNGAYSSLITGPSEAISVANGVTFYNNTLEGYSGCIYLRSSNTSDKTLFYNNVFASYVGTGITSSANTVTEDYNRFCCSIERNGPSSGTNSTFGVFGYDLDYSRVVGLYALDYFGPYSGSAVQNTGTLSGAPLTDIFSQTWIGVNPDVGASTFKIISGVGAYIPTERNASTITIAPGSTSQSIELYLGATGLTASTSGLSARYNRTRTASQDIPLVARTIAQAWTSGGFAEVDSTNMPGVYRIDLPDAALAAGADDVTIVVRGASGTNGAVMTVKLSSGGLTSAQTAAAVWDEPYTSHTAANTFGARTLKTTVDNRPAAVGASQHIHSNVHAIVDSTIAADELSGALLHNGTDYIDSNVNRISTSVAAADELEGALLHNGTDYIDSNLLSGNSTRVFVGRFQMTQTGTTQGDIIEAFTTDTPAFELQLFDGDNNLVPVTGATLGLRILDVTSTVVETGTPTIEYGTGGIVRWTAPGTYLSIGCPAGMYRMFVDRTVSGTTTTFGPLQIKVQVQ